MQQVDSNNLPALTKGLAFLGSGGGGDTANATLMAQAQIVRRGPVLLTELAEVANDALVLPLALMGAPSVVNEKLDGYNGLRACVARAQQEARGREVLLSVAELGGANGLMPLLVANALGLKLVDADLIGRAFPELQMASTSVVGPKAGTAVFAASSGETAVVEVRDVLALERVGRALCVSFGGSMAVIPQLLTGVQAKAALLAGGLARAVRIGSACAGPGPLAEALARASGGRHLLRARIAWVERQVQGGFVRGTVHLEGPAGDVTVVVQNEFLAVYAGGAALACSPDIVALVDLEAQVTLTADSVEAGAEVDVIVCPAPALWYTPAGRALVGPEALGLAASSCQAAPAQQQGGHHVSG